MKKFIGRKQELAILKALLSKRTASLVVIKGRHRIGKSRLLEEFSKSFKNAYTFSGTFSTQSLSAQRQLLSLLFKIYLA